jgi:hypothetical protein
LGNALLATFEHAADTARVEAAGAEGLTEIVTDGYKFEVLLSGRPCVELANPPPESEAGRLAGLVRFLDKRTLSWRRSERMEFEADVTRMITAADVRRGELEPPR